MHSVSSLLLLAQTVTWDTHFPLYWFPFVSPHGRVGWWKGMGNAGLGARAGLAAGTPASVSLRLVCPPVPVLKAAHVSWDVSTSIEGCFCGCPTSLPASHSLCAPPLKSLLHTPHLKRSSLWFSLTTLPHPAYCSPSLPGILYVRSVSGSSVLP